MSHGTTIWSHASNPNVSNNWRCDRSFISLFATYFNRHQTDIQGSFLWEDIGSLVSNFALLTKAFSGLMATVSLPHWLINFREARLSVKGLKYQERSAIWSLTVFKVRSSFDLLVVTNLLANFIQLASYYLYCTWISTLILKGNPRRTVFKQQLALYFALYKKDIRPIRRQKWLFFSVTKVWLDISIKKARVV